jgi:hypothetical protein
MDLESKLGLWKAFLKVKFTGSWWKISLIMNLASLLRLKQDLYSGGTGEE